MDANLTRRVFLGVERSATARVWRDRLDERGNLRALSIVQRHGLPELLARIIAGRGIEPDDVETYLDPTIKRFMPDPDPPPPIAPPPPPPPPPPHPRDPIPPLS